MLDYVQYWGFARVALALELLGRLGILVTANWSAVLMVTSFFKSILFGKKHHWTIRPLGS